MSSTELLAGTERRRAPAALGVASGALVIRLVNQERRRHGLGPVRRDAALTRAAKARARQLDARNSMDSHLGWEPTLRRLKLWGTQGLGENIAQGFRTARSVMAAWMNSPTHRENILRPEYRRIGVGLAAGFWAQEFGDKR